MDDEDALVRTAAFAFLAEQSRTRKGALPIEVLRRGFEWRGRRVPLMFPGRGIFKPSELREIPLSITTAPEVLGKERPYDDGFTKDNFVLYRYQGRDVGQWDNRGLRLAMTRRTPLVYFFGLRPGLYLAEWPAYIVADDPDSLCFTVTIDDHQALSGAGGIAEWSDFDVRRAYAMRAVRSRMHQRAFRERVIRAYTEKCAICRLRHEELLDAAHIIPDSDPRGVPVIPNGISLCKLHHAAFDENIVGVTPDFVVEVRSDVLDEEDGPMLLHGLKGFHLQKLHVPRAPLLQPNREFLEERYAAFSRAG